MRSGAALVAVCAVLDLLAAARPAAASSPTAGALVSARKIPQLKLSGFAAPAADVPCGLRLRGGEGGVEVCDSALFCCRTCTSSFPHRFWPRALKPPCHV
jgi:hypothetical protein